MHRRGLETQDWWPLAAGAMLGSGAKAALSQPLADASMAIAYGSSAIASIFVVIGVWRLGRWYTGRS